MSTVTLDAPLLTAEQLSEKLQVHPATILRWAREERIPCVRVGQLVRFDPRHVAEVLGGKPRRTAKR